MRGMKVRKGTGKSVLSRHIDIMQGQRCEKKRTVSGYQLILEGGVFDGWYVEVTQSEAYQFVLEVRNEDRS